MEFNFNELVKNIKKDPTDYKSIRLAILGNCATQFLVKAVTKFGQGKELKVEIFEADYNQVDLQVFDPNSSFNSKDFEYVILALFAQPYKEAFSKLPINQRESYGDDILEKYNAYLAKISKEKPNSKVILLNQIKLIDNVFCNYSGNLIHSWTYQQSKINFGLLDLVSRYNNAYLCDVNQLVSDRGYSNSVDNKFYYSASMAVNLDTFSEIAYNIIQIIGALEGQFKKCLILDLDNTTWGGIIGDDGIEKIQVGNLGIGKAFTDLQVWAKNLKERGIILAVCSKNSEDVAKEPFLKHPDMVLRLEDIAVFVANWENKADNIKYIKEVLNIGYDSMVFLDDNKFERELVKQAHPEVLVPELPEDPVEYLNYLNKLKIFETTSFSKLDSDRTLKYQAESKRKKIESSYEDFDDFLENLEMKSSIAKIDNFNIPRIAQLSQRSNQFNLRTIRYDEHDITKMRTDEGYHSFAISLEDKFGQHGLISVILLREISSEKIFIDTWIMSCRVLKRDVEKMSLNIICEYLQERNYKELLGEYIPTKKNILVKDHYKNLGFTKFDGDWILDLESFKPFEHYINVNSDSLQQRIISDVI